MTGELDVSGMERQFVIISRTAGFLQDETYMELRQDESTGNSPSQSHDVSSHAGSAYPGEPAEIRSTLNEYFKGSEAMKANGNVIGIAAPARESLRRLADLP